MQSSIKISSSSSGGSSTRRSRSKSKERSRREKSRTPEWPREVEKSEKAKHVLSPKERASASGSSTATAPVESYDLTNTVDKEEEQHRLEVEMAKRRDRIERWRAERKRKELELKKIDKVVPSSTTKKWSLENESDDDDDVREVPIKVDSPEPVVVDEPEIKKIKLPPKMPAKIVIDDDDDDDVVGSRSSGSALANDKKKAEPETTKQEEEEEEDDGIDPLDAFMQEVYKEVRSVNNMSRPAAAAGSITVVTGVVKKSGKEVKKGEMMEQNQDGMEYSSEEEVEDIKDTAANLANKHKKELAKIDHSGVNYMPFRKDFYVEVPELARMKPEEVEAYKAELEGVQVKGKGCPKPIKTWAHCGVSKKEMDVLRKLGFDKPTPIQCQAIPAIMSGRDLIGIAKTGSGKTLAFILPMFRHILDQPELEDGDGPIAIIMAPTRELCMQIGKDIRKFSKSLNLRGVCVYGGTGISEQIAELKRGAEIIICTPGRMIDMLAANSGRVTNLRRVTYVVLDEADRMFDMGFEPQVMRIVDNIRPDRQTVMFSATFPRQMEALARRILKKPVEVQIGGRSVVCKDVEQHVAILEEDAKFFKLLELLGQYQEHGSIIVFVDKQENADILLKDLMKASYPCMSLHGGIDQFDRDSTILDFKSGRVKLLIATSVAARGLDVKQLILVVNYDCPNHYEDYVHRYFSNTTLF